MDSEKRTVDFQTACDLNDLLEDAVEYICHESFKRGRPVSGETIWDLVSCYSITKSAEFQGLTK